jgi:hypothetical protein
VRHSVNAPGSEERNGGFLPDVEDFRTPDQMFGVPVRDWRGTLPGMTTLTIELPDDALRMDPRAHRRPPPDGCGGRGRPVVRSAMFS